MDLNYAACFSIAFIPLVLGFLWYHPKSLMHRWVGIDHPFSQIANLTPLAILWAFFLSVILVYGYTNLIIHQLGFYELFFTDIMMGSDEAKQVTTEFLAKYGQKHRHFGHGVFHGAINTFVVALPFLGFYALLEGKTNKELVFHFLYWLITSMIMGGLIAEFV